MPDRAGDIRAFLAAAGWADARRTPLAGDLSARRYVRLFAPDGRRAVLMDAPPDTVDSTPAFVAMTRWLSGVGLSVPEILAADEAAGLLLLEDFGDARASDRIKADPAWQASFCDAATEVLRVLRGATPPDLPRPAPRDFAAAVMLTADWYPGARRENLAGFAARLEDMIAGAAGDAAAVTLRDFHAENVIWLPDREGPRRLGLLDYQDAIVTHPVYDLVSLLTDARVAVPAPLRTSMIDTYAQRTGDDPDSLAEAFAVFSAQRNLRILGVFARAARRDGKRAHLSLLPRVHGYLVEAVSHPVFAGVAADDLLPAPGPAILADLGA